jgi:predicted Zn-dependent protease
VGHEIGHVTARHHVTQISRAQLAQIGLGIGGVLFPELGQLGGLAGAGFQLLFLSHGREAERQADDLGFAYALDNGFDVREMSLVFASLQRLGQAQAQQSAIPSWLMTHPEPGDRIQAVERRLAEAGITGNQQLRIGGQTYLDQLDGLVYGRNPRNGFFRDDLFLHPDIRFQIRFPSGWEKQNLAQAVLAVSPQQNAVVQLSIAEAATMDAAAQRFLTQEGLQPGRTSRETVNGLPAIFAGFRAQSGQQLLQGLVTFIAYGGRVFQLIGYTPVEAYPGYESTLLQTFRSFAQLTDPQALAVQPNRIRIVRTTQTMTLTQFNQRFPSAIPIAELAVLNQLPGPDAVIPAGAFVKQVEAG